MARIVRLMTGEVELKLSLPPTLAAKVSGLPWLRKLRDGPRRREQLHSVYFDTPKSKLHGHGLTFRVRRSGARHLQTIKATNNGPGGAFARGEWEQEIDGNRPVLKLAKGTPLRELVTKKLRRKLRPIFQTAVHRTRIPLRSDSTELELAVDRGQIRRYGRPDFEAISEIEVELKKGDRLELSKIAKRLARSVPVAYGPLSKAERGYALANRESQGPMRARRIVLDIRMSVAEAFAVIGLSCLDHALSNERAVRVGDPEGVHQMRIGLRRLRTTLSIFKEFLQGAELRWIKSELRWLTEQLSPARDVDVLLEHHVKRLREHTPVATEAGVLGRALNVERAAGLDRARAVLDSERYRMLGLRTALWLAEGTWSRSPNTRLAAHRDRSVKKFASEVLRRRSKKLLKKAREIGELDAPRRHKLRIASKKLRYGAESFGSLFSGKKREVHRKRFVQGLKTLQAGLGTLNDIEVHKRFATRIASHGKPSRAQSSKAFAMGYITGEERKQVTSCVRTIAEATEYLARVPKFWK